MKPILEYIRLTPLLKNDTIVQFEQHKVRRLFNDRQELIAFIDTIDPPVTADTVLYIRCGCKLEFIYATREDIPATEVYCICGQKVIVYGRDS